MPLFEGFIGPAYRARSATIAADALINLFPEVTETPAEAKHATYYGTPACKFFLTGPDSGCRGSFSQDGVTLTVLGSTFCKLNTVLKTATAYASPVPNDGAPVTFASNGRGGEQVAVCGGGELHIYDLVADTFSAAIALPLTNAPVMVDFMDGYFLLSEANTVRIWFSALEDGTTWDALDFLAVSLTSSNVVGIKVLRDRLWVLQSQSALVYYNSGDADNPFVPYPGSVMQEGCVTPWSIAIMGESIFWLAQDNQGRNRFVTATDYAPTVISTPPISFALAALATTTCEVLAYEQEGHGFVCWTVEDRTFCWDVRESQWHERDYFNQTTGFGTRWRARGVCVADNAIIVGDYQTATIYTLDLDTFTDNGNTIRRLRRAPYLSSDNQWIFLDQIEMGIQWGVGTQTGQGADPQLMLALSRDNGHTYDPPMVASMGAVGVYSDRANWYMLGRVRSDRLVIEVTQTDPVRAVWGPGLWLRATPGSGQL